MIVFLDTEFTSLTVYPRLLSVGLVAGDPFGGEFYAEVTDGDRLQDASSFALHAVLPQFGKVNDAACPYVELGVRLWTFFDHRLDALSVGDNLEVAFTYDFDWSLTRLAIKDASRTCWKGLEGRLRPRNVFGMPGFRAGELASIRYFEAQAHGPLSRHHALCDARALRADHEAATASARQQERVAHASGAGQAAPR